MPEWRKLFEAEDSDFGDGPGSRTQNRPTQTAISPGKRADGQKMAIGKILFGATKGGRADG